jgi:hypothetical protein
VQVANWLGIRVVLELALIAMASGLGMVVEGFGLGGVWVIGLLGWMLAVVGALGVWGAAGLLLVSCTVGPILIVWPRREMLVPSTAEAILVIWRSRRGMFVPRTAEAIIIARQRRGILVPPAAKALMIERSRRAICGVSHCPARKVCADNISPLLKRAHMRMNLSDLHERGRRRHRQGVTMLVIIIVRRHVWKAAFLILAGSGGG